MLSQRLQDLGSLETGQRFILPGSGRTGRVRKAAEASDDAGAVDGQVLVELDPLSPSAEQRTLRASLRVQPMPDPPAEAVA